MRALSLFRGEAVGLIDGLICRVGLGSRPKPRKWSRAEYLAMAEHGLFQDQRVELIDGEVVTLSPQSASHYASLSLAARCLEDAFGAGFWVRTQVELNLSGGSQPEPDVSVVEGTVKDYPDHPTTAVLVVEVSRSTLRFDQVTKAGLYAAARVPEYWVINLVDRQLEVHREPVDDPSSAFGARYARQTVFAPGETVSPLAAATARVAVADLFS